MSCMDVNDLYMDYARELYEQCKGWQRYVEKCKRCPFCKVVYLDGAAICMIGMPYTFWGDLSESGDTK